MSFEGVRVTCAMARFGEIAIGLCVPIPAHSDAQHTSELLQSVVGVGRRYQSRHGWMARNPYAQEFYFMIFFIVAGHVARSSSVRVSGVMHEVVHDRREVGFHGDHGRSFVNGAPGMNCL